MKNTKKICIPYEKNIVIHWEGISMDIRQLRYFYTIAQEGQITRAAKRLHMAQPPLSQQLKLLEQELGVQLLERNGRKLELTEAGHVLFKKTKEILTHFHETITEVIVSWKWSQRNLIDWFCEIRFLLYSRQTTFLPRNISARDISLAGRRFISLSTTYKKSRN